MPPRRQTENDRQFDRIHRTSRVQHRLTVSRRSKPDHAVPYTPHGDFSDTPPPSRIDRNHVTQLQFMGHAPDSANRLHNCCVEKSTQIRTGTSRQWSSPTTDRSQRDQLDRSKTATTRQYDHDGSRADKRQDRYDTGRRVGMERPACVQQSYDIRATGSVVTSVPSPCDGR